MPDLWVTNYKNWAEFGPFLWFWYHPAMRDILLLFVPVVVTVVRLVRPSGLPAVLAESALVRHQLLILQRGRKRAPNLRVADRIIAGLCKYGWRFQVRDKVIQTENNYEKEVFNGDIGTIEGIDPIEQDVLIRFDNRLVKYDFGELEEVSFAYAVTIHKAQGSEFPAVVMPLATQHYVLLQRNLLYTGITRGKKLAILIGQKKALGIAVRNDRTRRRYSGLLESLRGTRA
jgi:ATP-dependent exoDNAse (exonuclease V) alpha subunit